MGEKEIKISKRLITDSKGITIVALIVTIIVMLILAGVTISQTVDQGTVDIAKEVSDDSQERSIITNIQIKLLEKQEINNTITEDDLKEIVSEYGEYDAETKILKTESGKQIDLTDIYNDYDIKGE